MGLINDFISKISPSWAYKRESFRQGYLELKSYDAGSFTKNNQNWRTTNLPGELEDRYDRDTVRARARDLERNSDIMNSVLGAHKRNIVGKGYMLQAKTSTPELNNTLEKAWKKWCEARNCDVTGVQSFNQIIRMAVLRKKVDGGIIFLKRYTKQGIVPFQLQMLEVDELDTTTMSPKKKGNRVIGGIEYNKWNRPVGYWIKQYDLDGIDVSNPVYIDAKDVIFMFSKRRPSQLREMSDLAPSITRVRDVNEFMTAVSVKERIAACLSVFIKKMLPTTGIGRAGENRAERTSYDGKSITPGMIKELNAGDEIQVVNPNGQSADATAFAKLQQRMIGAGQGISYEATSRDMSESNYSSARQGIIEDDLTYEEDREILMAVLDEIYTTFVISAVLSGYVNIPTFWENKEEYLGHEWIRSPKPWIDPLKESNANKIALNTCQKTFKQIAAENGKDWKTVVDDMVEVIEYGRSKGIELGGVLFGESAVNTDESETDESGTDESNEE